MHFSGSYAVPYATINLKGNLGVSFECRMFVASIGNFGVAVVIEL